MSAEVAVTVERVHKKFRRGELHDSLRDLIPALAGRMLGRTQDGELRRQEFWALQDVSFTVARGEAFGVIGGNGAGKSTMLKLLTGILRPTRGDVRVRGRLSALLEVSAGFHPDLTGRENIYLNGTILGMTRAEIRRRFDEIVAFSGLEEFIDTPVKRYSSGMFARLGFSVAAHVDPDVLLIDEVLSVGDHVFQKRCTERMHQVLTGGTTILFVSHNLRAVASLCRRVLLLERGKAVMIGSPDDVIGRYLSGFRGERQAQPGSPVLITHAGLKGGQGTKLEFASGGPATIEVTFRALAVAREVSVVIQILNEDFMGVFDCSTTRLGVASLELAAGDEAVCAFDLDLHLAPGTYHLSAWLHHYTTHTELDHWDGAATFFVTSDTDVRGIANLYPRARLTRLGPGANRPAADP